MGAISCTSRRDTGAALESRASQWCLFPVVILRALVVTSEHVRHWSSRKSQLHRAKEGACDTLAISIAATEGTKMGAHRRDSSIVVRDRERSGEGSLPELHDAFGQTADY